MKDPSMTARFPAHFFQQVHVVVVGKPGHLVARELLVETSSDESSSVDAADAADRGSAISVSVCPR